MKPYCGFVLLVVGLALLAVAPSGAAFIAGTPPHGPSPPPFPSPLLIDLTVSAPTSPLVVPAGVSVPVVLANGSPKANYRFATQARSSSTSSPPSDALKDGQLPVTLGFSAACDALTTAAQGLFSLDDEREVAQRLGPFEALLSQRTCPRQEHSIRTFLEGYVRRHVAHVGPLGSDERSTVTIERVDAAGRTVKRWQVEIVARGFELKLPYPTESAALAAAVAEDLAAMIDRANGRAIGRRVDATVDATGALQVRVQKGLPRPLRIDGVWSPEAYAALVKGLLGTRTASASSPPRAAGSLLDLKPPTIVAEDRRVSARLSRSMLDPAAHDEAALVLVAFALREAAGPFSDLRPALNRMTAHLAMARVLAPKPTTDGALAAAALLALSGRQKEALEALTAIPDSPAVSAWKRALTLRTTGDWRPFGESLAEPRVVALEQFRAVAARRDEAAALALIEPAAPPPLIDFARISLGTSFSVELANRFALSAEDGELGEGKDVWRNYGVEDATPAALIDRLNAVPAGCVRSMDGKTAVEVIGWAQWAAFLQRHLLAALDRADSAHWNLGLPEEQRKFRAERDEELATLEMLPLWRVLRRPMASRDGGPFPTPPADACRRVATLLRTRPIALAASAWAAAAKTCVPENLAGAIPNPSSWFRPLLPAGTLYEAGHRLTLDRVSASGLDVTRLHSLAPFDLALAFEAIDARFGPPTITDSARSKLGPLADALKRRGTPDQIRSFLTNAGERPVTPATAEQVRSLLGPLAEYDTRALRRWVEIADRSAASEIRQRLCALDPAECFELGAELAAEGKSEEAATVLERGATLTRDRVRVANNVGWLVDHHWEQGRRERALQLARDAADTYTGMGLYTMARLLERARRYDEAVQYYRRIAERYDDPTSLQAFLIRHQLRKRDGRFAKEAEEARAKVFPDGMTPVTVGTLPAVPPLMSGSGAEGTGGVPIRAGSSKALLGAGLRPGDVVVAIDGIGVRNRAQWEAVIGLLDHPMVTFIIYRGTYKELTVAYPRPKYEP